MAEKTWLHGLPRLALGVLFALGLTLPLLSAMELMSYALAAFLIQTGMAAGLYALSLLPRIRRFIWPGIGILTALWLLLGGWTSLQELAMALNIHLTGRGVLLPFYRGEIAMGLMILIGIIGYGALTPEVGGVAPTALLTAIMMILWISGHQERMIYALPAVAALLAALPLNRQDGLSWKQAVPIALAVSVLGFLLVPAGGAVIPPLKETADRLRQQIMDHLFFTEPRDIFSLAIEGYYPQGSQQMGGMPNPSDHPVMQVQTPKRVYLKGTSRDEYTGRSWVDTLGGRRYLWVGPQWGTLRTETFNMAMPEGRLGNAEGLTRSQEISVQMISDSTSTLFVPQRVRMLTPAGDLVPYFNHAGEIFITRNLAGGDTYTVTAPLMTAMDAGVPTLVQACASNADPYYAVMEQRYTALPDHLEQAVYDLAYRVTAGTGTPYDRALAMQNYLIRSLRYSLDVAMQPTDQDFVTQFLFISQEGYCTHFASAMTVLCRMLGLPARYVEGYIADPDESGTALVTGLNAHAWTEIYFHGFGWLTFDATPHSGETGRQDHRSDGDNEAEPSPTSTPEPPPPSDSDIPTPEPTPEPNPNGSPEDEPTPPPSLPETGDEPPPSPFPWLLLLLLLLLAGMAYRLLQVHYPFLMGREKTVLGRYVISLQQMMDLLAVRGIHRRSEETPAQFLLRAAEAVPTSPGADTLAQPLNRLLYGRILPLEEDLAGLSALCAALWTAASPFQKAWHILRRMVLSLKRRDSLLLRKALQEMTEEAT